MTGRRNLARSEFTGDKGFIAVTVALRASDILAAIVTV